MKLSHWLTVLIHRIGNAASRRRHSRRPGQHMQAHCGVGAALMPMSEALEDRTLLATFTVSNTNDANAGSLRQAVLDANGSAGHDTIQFQPGVTGTVNLASTLPEITEALTIVGPGAADFRLDGQDTVQIMKIGETGTFAVSISDVTFQNGRSTVAEAFGFAGPLVGGGAIRTGPNVTLNLDGVEFVSNVADGGATAALGAALFALGPVNVTQSTFDSNSLAGTSSRLGGAVALLPQRGPTTYTFENSTFFNNQALSSGPPDSSVDGAGGAIFSQWADSTVVLTHNTFRNNASEDDTFDSSGGAVRFSGNTGDRPSLTAHDNIFESNIPHNFGGVPSATFTTTGGNIFNPSQPNLEPHLHANDVIGTSSGVTDVLSLDPGARVRTLALPSGAFAVGKALGTPAPIEDGRGFIRDGAPDSGAHEFGAAAPVSNTSPAISVSDLSYTEGDSSGNPVVIDSSATATDDDGDADWDGGSLAVQITNNAEATDEISIGNQGDVTVVGSDVRHDGTSIGTIAESSGTSNDGVVTNGAVLTINFNSAATSDRVRDVVRAIRYRSTSTNPSESAREVTFTVTDRNSGSGSDTSTITVTAVPEVTVAVSNSPLEENAAGTIDFTFTRTPSTAGALTVNFSVSGSAVFGTDYSQTGAATFDAASGTVTIPDGDTMATVQIDPAGDTVFEADETVILTVTSGTGYNVGSPNADTGTIDNDEMPTADLSVMTDGDEDGPVDIVFTVTLSLTNETGSEITFDLDDPGSGTATSGDDYTAIAVDAMITVADGRSTGTLTVLVTDDTDVEGTETLTGRISNPGNTDVTVNTSDATADITDNDAIISNFVWDDANENGIQDMGEAGVDGVTVNLLNAAGNTQLDTTTTAMGGMYSFTVAPGTYIVEFVSPAGRRFSPQDKGMPNDDATDSDADTVTGRTGQITVVAGQTDDSHDAGLFIDNTAPNVSVNSVTTTDNRPPLNGMVDDPTATVVVHVDGQMHTASNNGDGTWTLADNTLTTLAAGVHNVVVTATDRAQNVGTDPTVNELAIAVLAFDFGAVGSPVEPGYTQVLTTNLKAGNAFGWLSNTGIEDRDRTNVSDDVKRDYHKTNQASATFQADLADGVYNVTFVIGSGSDPRNGVRVLMEGTEAAIVTTAPGEFSTQTHPVTVSGGILDVELQRQGATSTGINGLIILPATLEPRVDATDTATFHRSGDPAAAIDPTLELSDPDDMNLTGATVRISSGLAAGDTLAFVNTANITGMFDAMAGVLTLSGTDTVANYRDALRSVTYAGPVDGSRTIEFAASDGTTGTGLDSRLLTVLPAGGANPQFDFNAAGSPTEPGYTPVEIDNLFSDVLGFGWLDDAVTNGITARDRGTPDALRQDYHKVGSGTMTFAVSLPNGQYDVTIIIGSNVDARNNVGVFLEDVSVGSTVTTAATQFAENTYRTTVGDGRLEIKLERQGSTGIGVSAISIAEVTGAPRVTLADGPAVFETGGAAVPVDNALTVEDINSASLTGATVSIIGGHVEADDVLNFSNQNNITGSYNAMAGVLTLSGADAVANYQAALRSVTFGSTTAAAGTRTIEVTVNDGTDTGSDAREIVVREPFTGTARFDFGTQTSVVEPGFAGVDEATAFSSALGYGWLSTTGIESRERTGPVPLDERRDYNLIRSGSMTFAVSLPNDTYNVQITIGSSENARDNVGISLEGTQVDTISTATNSFSVTTYMVTLTDNRLEIDLTRLGSSSAGINALTITETP